MSVLTSSSATWSVGPVAKTYSHQNSRELYCAVNIYLAKERSNSCDQILDTIAADSEGEIEVSDTSFSSDEDENNNNRDENDEFSRHFQKQFTDDSAQLSQKSDNFSEKFQENENLEESVFAEGVFFCSTKDYDAQAQCSNNAQSFSVKLDDITNVPSISITREPDNATDLDLVNPVPDPDYRRASVSSEEAACDPSVKLKDEQVKKVRKISVAQLSQAADVSNYRKVCTIGTGTFGRVHLVQSKRSFEFFALKIMKIADVIQKDQKEHVKSEKDILESIQHQFIVNLHWAYKDHENLYMLFDFVPGGELFSYLRTAGRFPNSTAKFYAAEIVCVLDYLHRQRIIFRDLKPENLLLDVNGHLKVTDFGFAKKLDSGRTWTLCGTPEYLAPEVIAFKGHNKAVDWWALGVLVFEMLSGYSPFAGRNAVEVYDKVQNVEPQYPKTINRVAKDLCQKLMTVDRTKRLGSMKNGTEDVKGHRWFKSICWEDLLALKIKPPIVPKVDGPGDVGNFDEYDEDFDYCAEATAKDSIAFELK